MRPHTLQKAFERLQKGTMVEIALGEFLDHYYASTADARRAALADEPMLCGKRRLDALAAAIAEHLSKCISNEGAPQWTQHPSRFLRVPWFTAKKPSPALREYLTFQSPAAFKRRNIMTDGEPLRRARTASTT